ncbi:MAG: hypothetical protein ACI9O1_000079 [Candidatus Thalassarchaeaceae archaeon]|jgi:hypothetical protein
MELAVIRTEDFQLAYRLIKKLRSLEVSHIQLEINQIIPIGTLLWFGTLEEVSTSKDLNGIACNINNIDYVVNKTLNKILAGPNVKTLTFGVDSGPRPGLAWFTDDRLIGSKQLELVDEVIDEIINIVNQISPEFPDKTLIKIGNGHRTISNRIVNVCLNNDFQVQLIDEKHTSLGSRHDHVTSAKSIGLKHGIPICDKLEIAPTRGEVREIQRISRLVSEGKATIPSNLAISVAIGNLSLIEAVKLHSK